MWKCTQKTRDRHGVPTHRGFPGKGFQCRKGPRELCTSPQELQKSCVTPGGKKQTGEDTSAPATVVTSWHESFSPGAFGLSSFHISWLRNSESDPKCITWWFAAQERPSRSLILPRLGSIVRRHSAWPPAWALCVILVSHIMTSRLYLVKSTHSNSYHSPTGPVSPVGCS